MEKKDWDKLFDLIEKAINTPYLTADEKGEIIRQEAADREQTNNLEEFLAQAGGN